MATPHRIDTEHDIDRATIRSISTMLLALGLYPEYSVDDKDAIVVTIDGDSGRLSCRAEQSRWHPARSLHKQNRSGNGSTEPGILSRRLAH